jgi:hypothetical protein
MIKLESGQSLKRMVRVMGVKVPVCAEITSDGISLWVKGHRKRVQISWFNIARASNTPLNVPSYLAGKPVELLQHQAECAEESLASKSAAAE